MPARLESRDAQSRDSGACGTMSALGTPVWPAAFASSAGTNRPNAKARHSCSSAPSGRALSCAPRERAPAATAAIASAAVSARRNALHPCVVMFPYTRTVRASARRNPSLQPGPADAMPEPIPIEISDSDWRAREAAEQAQLRLRFAVLLVVGVLLGAFVSPLTPFRGMALLLFVLVTAVAVASCIFAMSHWFPAAFAKGFVSFLAPNRGTAPRETSYSQIQAMAARGDVEGALRAYEEVITADPGAVDASLRAADLYASSGRDPARAAALLTAVRRVPGLSVNRDLYATQRLIDLYDGALRQPHRSLTELRRIIERHPATREAAFARVALARRRAESQGGPAAP